MSRGTLYGVGLGPGDPELMTLKAHRLISGASVVAYPAPEGGDSFARRIAAASIGADAEEIRIDIPMRPEIGPAQRAYDRAAVAIGGRLSQGQDVVTLCEGDPFFYGSFMYLFDRLAEHSPVEIVPGVTSLTACAAAAQRPLCARSEVLSAVPATGPDDEIAGRLAMPGALAILKVGRHLARIRDLVAASGRAGAVYISHATLPNQHVVPLAEAPAEAPYFSMILLPGQAHG